MNFKRLATCTLAVALVVGLAAGSASAAQVYVMATINKFVDGINKGDISSAVAACASPASIVDEFPPYEWNGPTACADWAKAFDAANKADGDTDGTVTLGKPWHVDITDDSGGYAVIPATYTYKHHGTPVAENGSVFTAVVKKTPAGWLITSWAWAKR